LELLMLRDVIASLRAIAATAVVCMILYPLALLAFAIVVAPEQRRGSLVVDDSGKPIGSRLLAQSFTQPGYFWPRPSAVDYNAAGAGGSNLSPLNPLVRERAEGVLARLALPAATQVPAELVTTSGAGLDPHITVRGALVQAPRIARAREGSVDDLKTLIDRVAIAHPAGVPGGEPLVNVLILNLELNREFPTTKPALAANTATP
jgi:K+-transporting ATPase ATPase C chain